VFPHPRSGYQFGLLQAGITSYTMERCIEIQIPTAVWQSEDELVLWSYTILCSLISVTQHLQSLAHIRRQQYRHFYTQTHTHTHTLISLLERIVSRLLNKCGYTIYYITHVIQLPGTILILPLSILDLFCDIL